MRVCKIAAATVLLLSFFVLPCSIQAKYSGGSGEPNTPYQIANVTDLLAMAADTNDYGKYFVLTADINLAPLGPCTTAIIAADVNNLNNSGFDGTAFTGFFDGNGHTISNLTIDTNGAENDYLGLFGQIGSAGEVKNLGLKNVSITSGSLSFNLGGVAGGNDGSISNCFSKGNISGGERSYNLGGLVGENDGSISRCYSSCTVTGGDSSSGDGGLVGINDVNGNISSCYSTGAVSGGDLSLVLGGLTGENSGDINDCYSTGDVSGGDYVGGLVGLNDASDSNISSCYFLSGSGPSNGIGTALTNTQMKQQSNFVGWDFDTIWIICEGVSYPKLIWQYTPSIVSPLSGAVLTGEVTLTAHTSDDNGVTDVNFYVREPNGGDGTPIDHENLPADFNGTTGEWEYNFDSNSVSNGNYVILADAIYGCGIPISSELVSVSISNKPVVPNIVGMTAADANTAIVDVNLMVGTITTAYSNTVAAGVVISQDPAAGTAVAIGSAVNYVKSLGKPVVPYILGMTAADANTLITSVDNLQVGTITTAYSNTVAAGLVISQDPAAGATVNTGSSVNYVKSLGKPVVPSIVGMTEGAANTAITSVDNLQVGTVTTAFSNTVAAGVVISQDPAAGTTVNTGSPVNYVKSLGKSTIVPNIVGKTVAAANAALVNVKVHLVLGTETTAFSNTVAVGKIISQNPAAGAAAAIGSKVNYVKSLGKPAVPYILGMTAADANALITSVGNNANLQVGTITAAYSNTVAAGRVISQNPASGKKVNTGSSVNYVKSLGKPIVPNIAGMTAAAANGAITSANLKVGKVTTTYDNTVAAGSVISQNPAAGAAAAIGSKVNYVKSLGKPIVPNIVGKTAAAANTALAKVGLTAGTVNTDHSITVGAGKIISQNPIAGTAVNTGSAVNYVKSLGKP
jgi:beta-lactam-binding protein with PASTA domain